MENGETQVGTVHLVGAGPGDPGLITARGLELLRRCDAVVYDRLAAPELVAEAPAGAERYFVGKEPGCHSSTQDEINELLVSLARRGLEVVRLKGGDPFVFGRGGEEAGALAEAGLAFDVVPGVSAAVAAPAYAGIPVTHRGVASSFAVVAGHPEGKVDWAGLAGFPGSLVLMMGVAGLRRATEHLIEQGRDPTEAAAIVEWGTTPRQRTVVGDLASIADLAEAAGIEPPATVVIGDVVTLRATVEWFQQPRGAVQEQDRSI
ncbi:MAG TPA: uroporphyrinogen-III C-methyltransferase [Actinomycetota bacterium]|nr:uroporphyrinogen-III C-methyltransferase [Actinomycetota bacterium]